jgi:polygalacturonase
MFCCICISAKTVNLSDYATPNDGQDDSPGFQDAINDLKESAGGTIVVTEGRWDLKGQINILYSLTASVKIVGSKGAVIAPHLAPNQILFYMGNLNQFEMRDLIFVGDGMAQPDLGYLLYTNYVDQTKILGCQFYGLWAAESLIFIGNSDAVIEDSLFHGIASRVANVSAVNFRGLTVSSTQFIDYGNYAGGYYSKTPYGNPTWIKLEGNASSLTANALSQRGVIISDVRFDEGARYAVDATNVSFLTVRRVMTNVSGMGDSTGIRMSNVGYATIEQSKFGYAAEPRPAVTALNNTRVLLNGLLVGNGVYHGAKDQTSEIHFDERFCTNCTILQARPAKY